MGTNTEDIPRIHKNNDQIPLWQFNIASFLTNLSSVKLVSILCDAKSCSKETDVLPRALHLIHEIT